MKEIYVEKRWFFRHILAERLLLAVVNNSLTTDFCNNSPSAKIFRICLLILCLLVKNNSAIWACVSHTVSSTAYNFIWLLPSSVLYKIKLFCSSDLLMLIFLSLPSWWAGLFLDNLPAMVWLSPPYTMSELPEDEVWDACLFSCRDIWMSCHSSSVRFSGRKSSAGGAESFPSWRGWWQLSKLSILPFFDVSDFDTSFFWVFYIGSNAELGL